MLLLLRCCLAASLCAASPAGELPAPVAFPIAELLHHPTHDAVTLTLLPGEAAEAYVAYGGGAIAGLETPRQRRAAGELFVFRLEGLHAGGEFAYVVHARRPGEEAFQPRDEHAFRTLAGPGETFSFGVLADSHAWALWSQSACSVAPDAPWEMLQRTLAAVRDDESLDFVVNGTDLVMTSCGACESCPWEGEPSSAGSVASLAEARLRYRRVLAPDCFGLLGARRPQVMVLGDHDGEEGWSGLCGATAEIATWSREARLAHVPNASDTYAGNRAGSAYAFTAGDVLVVVIDPLSTTADITQGPGSWTLGEHQLRWLDRVLAASDAAFKLVFAEHLVGGLAKPGASCWKGRGGLRATTDGSPTAPFLGEQALVHEILKARGAQLFFGFHDHVVAFGEKLGEDGLGEGVHYVVGGRAGGVGAAWTSEEWYRQTMDYDGDGVPEYLTDVTGTLRPGYFRVTSHGGERLELLYLATAPLPGGVSEPLLGFTIER